MKELILMRHAKSSWDLDQLTDHERPLNKRGIKDAKRAGEILSEMDFEPQLVLSSDSQRTQETWRLISKGLSRKPLVCFLPSLYLSSIGAIQEAIEFIHPQTQRILLLGHNPGWSEAQGWLTGKYVEFKTATIGILSHESDNWQDAIQTPHSWKQLHIIHPNEL